MTIFEDEIVNNKAFEHANLIFTEPWALTNEIMLNVMQNFKFDFLKNEFCADRSVHIKFHFHNLNQNHDRGLTSERYLNSLKHVTGKLKDNRIRTATLLL